MRGAQGKMLYAAALVVTMMLSCSAPGSGAAGPVHAVATADPLGVRLPDSAGYMYSLAWLGDGTLVAGSDPNAAPSIEQVWQLRQDGSDVRQLPNAARQRLPAHHQVHVPDSACGRSAGTDETCDSANVAVDTVVAYDLKSLAFTTLADLGGAMHVGAVSWNPDLTRGIGAQSSRTCSDVAWVASNGPQGIAVEISEGGKAWRDHLRIAWTLLQRYPREVAFARLQEGTKRACDAHGCPDKYSRELTERWSVAIASAMDEVQPPGTLDEMLERHPELRRGGHFVRSAKADAR